MHFSVTDLRIDPTVRKQAVVLCWLAAGTCGAAAADLPTKIPAELLPNVEQTAQGWTATFASEIRYYTWSGDVGFPARDAPQNVRGGGSQIYVPFALQIEGRPNPDFELVTLVRGGWVSSRQTTPGLSGAVETFTDTVVSSTVTYFGFNGVQPFVSLAVNAPTGASSLSGNSANARMDPDLVEIANFGEGWNVGPTVGVNVPLGPNFIVTASAGYTWRGRYERDDSLAAGSLVAPAPSLVDPGEVITATGSISYQSGPFSSLISGSASWETETSENGTPLYRPGTRYLITGRWTYNAQPFGATTLTAAAQHARPNEVLLAASTPSITDEPANTNSNLYRVGIEHLFPIGQLWAGPTGSFLYRDHNTYDSATLQFVPAKTRWSAGVVARYAAGNITFNARAEHVWTKQNEDPAPGGERGNAFDPGTTVGGTPVPVVSSKGWQVAFGANVRY